MRDPFGSFNSSPEVIRLVVMMYIRYPLSLRHVEDILFDGASTSVTRRFGSGGTVSVRSSPMRSGSEALSEQICDFAKTSEPDFAAIDFPAFFRVDLSGSMAAPSI